MGRGESLLPWRNFPLLLSGRLGFRGGTLTRGAPVRAGKVVPGEELPREELPGTSNGAGCKVELSPFGNAFIDGADPNPFEFEKGDEFASGEFEANPLDGVLLKMSKPLDEFPELFDAIGLGPETSGVV